MMRKYYVRFVGTEDETGNWDIVELDFDDLEQAALWLRKHSCRTGGYLYDVVSIYDTDEEKYIDIPANLK